MQLFLDEDLLVWNDAPHYEYSVIFLHISDHHVPVAHEIPFDINKLLQP